MSMIVKTLWKIASAKIIFSKPKKAKTVVWGVPLFSKKVLNQKKFNLGKIEFIEIWGKSYNFHILLRCLLKLKFSLLDYSNEYLSFVNPKIILSFLDNYKIFYKLKKNSDQKKILIQSAWRCDEFNTFQKDKSYHNHKVDYIFAQNINIKKKYIEISKSEVIAAGSFLSNEIDIKHKIKNIDVLYVSTFRDLKDTNLVINENISLKDYINSERKLIKNIYKVCKANNKTLHILPSQKKNSQKIEEYFFHKILGNQKNWKLIKRKSYNYKFPYKVIDCAKIVIGIDSTLLYESFGRGIKTIFCDIRPKNNFLKKRRHFGWPKKYNHRGFFWLNKNNFDEIKKVFLNVSKSKNKEWASIFKKYKSDLMIFDKNNSKFIRTIKEKV